MNASETKEAILLVIAHVCFLFSEPQLNHNPKPLKQNFTEQKKR